SELSFEEAFSMGARSAEEEQKRAVLRALKDLEYERSVGKISDEDFQEYSTRYRAEAKRLIRSMDESLADARKQVERELGRRIEKLAQAPEEDEDLPEASPSSSEIVEAKSSPEQAETPEKPAKITRACAACQTPNELDARFCKGCGAVMVASGERLCTACPARYPETDNVCPDCGTASEAKS
ncbi:MAG TPA: zinc ribbon domain-containing protein, partial [Polyangiaceae bacterium]